MTETKFKMIVSYVSMVIFIIIPIYRFFVAFDQFSLVFTFTSLAIAFGFGFYATRQFMKLEEENKNHLKDKVLKIPCPKCGKKLMELTSDKEKFVVGSYKGLVYCTVCDFEESKDEFDRVNPDHD